MKGRLHGLTVALLLFVLVNTVIVNLVLWLTGSHTTLHHTAAFLLGRAGEDSWEPMRQALEYVRGPQAKPLYSAVFFDRNIQFIYPPTSLLFLEPLRTFFASGLPSNSFLNLLAWVAVVLTAVLTSGLWALALTKYLGRQFQNRVVERAALAALVFSMTLGFYPIVKAFTLGQIQTWMTCLFAGASVAWATGRKGTSGAMCGLICLVKPQLGLLVVWSLLRREARFAAGWAFVVLPLGLVSLWQYGLANHWDYVHLLSFITRHSWSYYPNQSANGLLNRWFFIGNSLTWDPHAVAYNPYVFSGTLASAAVLIGAALFWRGGEHHGAELVDFFIAALSFTLASPLAWEHHYGIMMPMFAYVLPATLAREQYKTGSLLVLAVAYALASNLYEVTWRYAGTHLNVLESYLFIAALLLLAQLYGLRRRLSM